MVEIRTNAQSHHFLEYQQVQMLVLFQFLELEKYSFHGLENLRLAIAAVRGQQSLRGGIGYHKRKGLARCGGQGFGGIIGRATQTDREFDLLIIHNW